MPPPTSSLQAQPWARADFVLADISGHTRFLNDVGTAHAQELTRGDAPAAYPMMTTLLDSILVSLVPPFALAKLQGDVVFAYANEGDPDMHGPALRACLGARYRTLREHLERTRDAMTCSCDACSSVSGLVLKFFPHRGSYVAQTITDGTEPLGPDVTIAHQMLKNGVTLATGWRAYALISEAAMGHLAMPPYGSREQTLDPEHGDPVRTLAIPLG